MIQFRTPKNERRKDIRRRELIYDVAFFIFIIPVGYFGVVCAMAL